MSKKYLHPQLKLQDLRANPFACSSRSCLCGDLHGGANESVISMLKTIGKEENIEKFIKKAKDINDPLDLWVLGTEFIKITTQEQRIKKILS